MGRRIPFRVAGFSYEYTQQRQAASGCLTFAIRLPAVGITSWRNVKKLSREAKERMALDFDGKQLNGIDVKRRAVSEKLVLDSSASYADAFCVAPPNVWTQLFSLMTLSSSPSNASSRSTG
jgi:hypothetical protein